MTEKRMDNLLLGICITGFGLLSVSFLTMSADTLGNLPGLLFWLGLLLGIASQITMEGRRRKFMRSHGLDRRKMQRPRCGALTFSASAMAKVFDVACAVGLVVAVLVFAVTQGLGFACYGAVAWTVFSFCMHCVLNGRNYFFITHREKITRAVTGRQTKASGGTGPAVKRGAFSKQGKNNSI